MIFGSIPPLDLAPRLKRLPAAEGAPDSVGLAVPKSIMDATAEYLREQDDIALFLDEMCESRQMFADILSLIARLRAPPAPA
jgi:hypothetical protein